MPIYEYTCAACGHGFERMQKVADPPARKCPSCGRLKAQRMISRTSFVLKGDGWYATDYASKGRKADARAESESNGKTGRPPEGSSKTPEGASESKKSTKSTADVD
ncbi:MAG: FmdB family zinc ribbon protein [Nitrospinota bacterium]